MGRHLLAAAAVVVADTALLAAAYGNALHVWGVLVCALVLALVVVLSHRVPVAAFTVALGIFVAVGGAYVLLLWTAYQAGRRVVSRGGTAAAVGAALGGLGGKLLVRPPEPRSIPGFVCAYVVFVALPLLVGRYLAQHERLLSALDRNNRRLRRERELLAERERLRERLRIARDMHDSLGHRLSLVTIQASALEVSVPPP
ncbi:histidine kinase dimerization/phosphoacceptor domain-containing protein, partial [Actinoallomurus acaciae]